MPASLKNSRPAPRAKKSLGQHFLRREEICARIAALLLPRPEDRVLEIGPGPGALTRALEDGPHGCLKKTATGRRSGNAWPDRALRQC